MPFEPHAENTNIVYMLHRSDQHHCFATRKVQFLFFLNLKFQASAFFCDGTGQFVSVGNPEGQFSGVVAHLFSIVLNYMIYWSKIVYKEVLSIVDEPVFLYA